MTKLLSWKSNHYHGLNKQTDTKKILPLKVILISEMTHGLSQKHQVRAQLLLSKTEYNAREDDITTHRKAYNIQWSSP